MGLFAVAAAIFFHGWWPGFKVDWDAAKKAEIEAEAEAVRAKDRSQYLKWQDCVEEMHRPYDMKTKEGREALVSRDEGEYEAALKECLSLLQ
jgi:hypothetical protein